MTGLEKIGLFYLLTIAALAGLSMFTFQIDGYNYTAYLWALQYLAGVTLVAMVHLKRGPPGSAACWKPWLLWCGLLLVSLMWSPDVNEDTVNDVASLTMPIVVGMVASTTIRTRQGLTWLLRGFWIPLICVALFTRSYVDEILNSDWQWMASIEGYNVRSTALTAALIGCVFLAGFPRRILIPLGVWGACVALATMTSSRMAAVVLLAAPVLHPLYPAKRWNLYAVAAAAVVGLALLATPMYQRHFSDHGAGDNVADNGRLYAWQRVWEQSLNQPLIGGGVGSATDFVESFWEEITFVHNDYLRILFELGVVGLTAFVFLIVWQMRTLYQLMNRTDDVLRAAFAAVWLGFAGMLISSLTDNTISYHIYYMNPLFAVLGAGYGVYLAEPQSHAVRYEQPAVYGRPGYSIN